MKRFLFLLVLIHLFYSCKKDLTVLPIITSEVVQITEYTASVRCNIVSDGGSEIIRYGLFFGTTQDPETDGTDMEIVVSDSVPDVESFELFLGDLIPNKTYYVKAYASNKKGIAYGRLINFTTEDGPIAENIKSIVVDFENNIWCGTEAGLSKFDGTHWASYTTADGLVNNHVNVVELDNLGALWIGSKGGLSHFDGLNWTNYTKDDGLVQNDVMCIFPYPQSDNVLLGTIGNGLSGFNGSSFTAGYINSSVSLGIYGYIQTISVDLTENVWIGSSLTGLSMTDGIIWSHHIIGLDSSVMASICASNGTLWFGTARGIYKNSNNIWTSYSETNGLINNEVTSIVEDKDGGIWIGTKDGVSCFRDGLFTNYNKEDGLISNNINDLAIDLDGNIWIATEVGISKINYSDMR